MSLTSLGNVKRPIREQIRDLAKQVPRFVEKMSSLTKKHRLCVAAATIPVRAEGTATVYNECFFFGSAGD